MGSIDRWVLVAVGCLCCGCGASRQAGNDGTASEPRRVLLYTMSYGMDSHMMSFVHFARLLQARGHTAHLLLSADGVDSVPRDVTQAGLVLRTYATPRDVTTFSDDDFVRGLLSSRPDATLMEYIRSLATLQAEYCESLLRDRALLAALKRESFDALIVDYADNCGRIVADYLHVPTIVYSPTGLSVDPAMFPTPLGLVVMPLSSTLVAVDGSMTFSDRLRNTLVYLLGAVFWNPVWFGPFQSLRVRYDMNASLDIRSSLVRTLVLVRADFVLDSPRPLMPNVIAIGDVIQTPVRPLPSGPLADFIAGAGQRGFVVVSFGTMVADVGDNRAELLAGALARLPQRVVWRHAGRRPRAAGSNTLLVDWLPQNDLLAAGAVAFVSHCGLSSTFEAVRHGVPVVATPFAADGFANAVKLQRLGMAVVVDWRDETSLETRLYEALVDVTARPRFRQRAKRAASLIADQMTSPAEKLLYYVDYVSRHGVDHLTSSSLATMSTAQIYSIDVMVLIVLAIFSIVILVALLVYCAVVTTCRIFRSSNAIDIRKTKKQ